jgi:hypothetical protein
LAQAVAAVWNWGEDIAPLCLRATMAALKPLDAGSSGKFKTPCERMHLPNWTRRRLLDGPPVDAAPARTVVVVVASLATPAWGEPPPQAETARATKMTAGATTRSACDRFIRATVRNTR